MAIQNPVGQSYPSIDTSFIKDIINPLSIALPSQGHIFLEDFEETSFMQFQLRTGLLFQMLKQQLILSLLLVLSFSGTVLVNSDPTTTSILSVVPRKIVGIATYHNSAYGNFLGNPAKWIWNTKNDRPPDGYTEVFESNFRVASNGSAMLLIGADDSFTAYINGLRIGDGSISLLKFSFAIKLSAGLNSLRVVVTNRVTGSPAGLIFSIDQMVNGKKKYLVLSDISNTYISTPAILPQISMQIKQPNFAGNKAVWVWESRQQAYAQGYYALFEKIFNVRDIDGRFELDIAADSQFTVFLNDEKVGEGSSASHKYVFTVSLRLGDNRLRILVLNHGDNTSGALVFSLFQQIQNKIIRVLAISDTTITLLSQLVSYEPYYNSNFPDILGNGAVWVWDSRTGSHCENYTAVFQNIFQSQSGGPATVSVRADDKFTLRFNGVVIGSGDDWNRQYTYSVTIVPGNNTIQLIATNTVADSAAGVAFSVVRNGSVLTISNPAITTIVSSVRIPPGLANSNYLSTEAKWVSKDHSYRFPSGFSETFQATFHSDFPSLPTTLTISAFKEFAIFLNKVFVGAGNLFGYKHMFPLSLKCGKNELQVVSMSPSNGSSPGLIFTVMQDQSKQGCKCDAIAQCQPPKILNSTCGCQCNMLCIRPLVLNPIACKCIPCPAQPCQPGFSWSLTSCSCQPCRSSTPCPDNKVYDYIRCGCTCSSLTLTRCDYPFVWNQDQCSCQFDQNSSRPK